MFVKTLHLLHFKSWSAIDLEFSPGLNCLVGPNGIGKTNILDALHYLSLTKSYFANQDQQNIAFGEDFFLIEGKIDTDKQTDAIVCSLKKGHKKSFKRNTKEYEKLADHIGRYPCVVISPYDRDLIVDGGEVRRKFADNVLSQGQPDYLFYALRYNRALAQRNSFLKQMARTGRGDLSSLEVLDMQLCEYGEKIIVFRRDFAKELSPIVSSYYREISGGAEEASVRYKTQMNKGTMSDLLAGSLEKDRILQYTGVGPHRDDLVFELDGKSIRKYGSQGQQKSFLVALKLAQYDFFKSKKDHRPILLLDDIFDKLDDARVKRLISLVHDKHFGQIFISDTHLERTTELVKQFDENAKIFNLVDYV